MAMNLKRTFSLVSRSNNIIRICILKKILTLKSEYNRYVEVGALTNIVAIDLYRINIGTHLSHRLFGVCFVTVLLTGLMAIEISWIALVMP